MVAAVRVCWSHTTPRNVAVGSAVTSGSVSLIGFGLGFWTANNDFTVICAISAIFAAFLAGTSFKYMPIGSLERVVDHLSTLPSQFTALLKGGPGQPLGLDQIVPQLEKINVEGAEDAQTLKQILISAKTSLDQQSQEVKEIKEVNDKYKKLIDSFLPLLNQVGQQDQTYAATAKRITSLLGNIKSTDLESNQLDHLTTELPEIVKEGQQILVQRGNQLIELQKEIDSLKDNTGDLSTKIAENQKLLEEISAAKLALTEETEKLQKHLNGSA